MALVQFGAIITEIRGKVGDKVYSRNRGGSYVRTPGIYVDNPSASQLQIREYLSKAVQFWQHMTTDCQSAWTSAAWEWQKKMNHFRFGSHVGYNYFISSFIKKCVSDGFPFNSIYENPNFTSDTAWYKGLGWSISGDTANQSNSALSGFSSKSNHLFSNEYVYLSFEVKSITTGQFAFFLSSLFGTTQLFGNVVGVFNRFAFADYYSSISAYFQNQNNCTGSIDNAYVMLCNQFPSDILP